ncbi:transglutaminase-like domain-containing protein [Amedibacillus sp. YH-ame6]
MRKRYSRIVSLLLILVIVMCGCGDSKTYPSEYEESPSPTLEELKLPQASGGQVMGDSQGIVNIDVSNVNQGYLCATLQRDPGKKVKLSITKDDAGNSPYDLMVVGKNETFPFASGSGTYLVRILLNTTGDMYSVLFTQYIDVSLENEQIPFLYPNQIVDYKTDSKAIHKAFELTKKDTTVLQRIATLYNYVVDTIAYDDEKADQVDDIYVLPVVDETLDTKKGICFDYAALLTAMLRSQQIPTRLVTGNTSIEYHAWVEVYLPEKGWVSADVLLNSKKWSRMDPTFAASRADYEDGYEDKYYY